jgi:hypothetical protein
MITFNQCSANLVPVVKLIAKRVHVGYFTF